nr:MAG TPA: prohead serine protease [Caudoviricetes sp.]
MPFKPEQRQYRTFGEFGAPTGEADRAAYRVQGYATTFDVPYEMGRDGAGVPFYECIRSTALDGADMSDVIFQLNHQGAPLARLRNGSLRLERDSHGLMVTATLDGSQEAREQYEAIANGLIDRMSWGFTVPDDGWEYDRDTRTAYVTRVSKVFDVSCVSLPADEDTEISARSYLDGVIGAELRESQLRDREMRERLARALEI